MCLILIGWQSHPDFPLVIAANRDEFYARRTRPAAWWGQSVSLLAGRDEEAGGTWLGINRRGRVALLTNVRAPQERNARAPSRGLLVLAALQTASPLGQWVKEGARAAQSFNGFNLLIGEPLPVPARGIDAQLLCTSNRGPGAPEEARALAPGIYGLSNALLDTPWPKVTRAVAAFACQVANRINTEALLGLWPIASWRAMPSCRAPEFPWTGSARCRRSRFAPRATARVRRRYLRCAAMAR